VKIEDLAGSKASSGLKCSSDGSGGHCGGGNSGSSSSCTGSSAANPHLYRILKQAQ